MPKRIFAFHIFSGICMLYLLMVAGTVQPSEWVDNTLHDSIMVSEEAADNGKILVEIFLAPERKGDLESIRKEFAAFRITKVRPQVFRLGHPPENIAIGKNVPADVARMAIRLATTYNGGIKLLLPEMRLAPDYLAFGTSIFDESFQIPVRPEDVERLSDPKLTTAEFHALYRELAGEDEQP